MDTKTRKIVEAVLAANPTALLTGSLSLNMQGFATRRIPQDIDVWLPFGSVFNLIPGMLYPKTKKQLEAEKAAEVVASAVPTTPGGVPMRPVISLQVLRDMAKSRSRASVKALLAKYKVMGIVYLSADVLDSFYDDLLKIPVFDTDDDIDEEVNINTATLKAAPASKKYTDDEYDGPLDFEIRRYEYEGTKVEVHFGREGEKRNIYMAASVRCSGHVDILKEKLAFIRKHSPTKDRHRLDVIYFLTANFD